MSSTPSRHQIEHTISHINSLDVALSLLEPTTTTPDPTTTMQEAAAALIALSLNDPHLLSDACFAAAACSIASHDHLCGLILLPTDRSAEALTRARHHTRSLLSQKYPDLISATDTAIRNREENTEINPFESNVSRIRIFDPSTLRPDKQAKSITELITMIREEMSKDDDD